MIVSPAAVPDPLVELPEGVRERVLGCLPGPALAAASQVSRAWHRLLAHSPAWRRDAEAAYGPLDERRLRLLLRRSEPRATGPRERARWALCHRAPGFDCGGGERPLHVMVRQRDLEAAHRLIAMGADLEARDGAGRTALEVAIVRRDGLTVRTLARAGARVAPAQLAALVGFAPERAVRAAVARCPDAAQWRSHNGGTLLGVAVGAANRGALAALLAAGVPADALGRRGRTALQDAVRRGRRDCVDVLCRHGAELAAQDRRGWTAVHYAARRPDARLLRHLHVCHGAALDAPAGTSSPLHVAAAALRVSSVRYLLRQEAVPVDRRDAAGRTPAQCAARAAGDSRPVLALLLAHGASRAALRIEDFLPDA